MKSNQWKLFGLLHVTKQYNSYNMKKTTSFAAFLMCLLFIDFRLKIIHNMIFFLIYKLQNILQITTVVLIYT